MIVPTGNNCTGIEKLAAVKLLETANSISSAKSVFVTHSNVSPPMSQLRIESSSGLLVGISQS